MIYIVHCTVVVTVFMSMGGGGVCLCSCVPSLTTDILQAASNMEVGHPVKQNGESCQCTGCCQCTVSFIQNFQLFLQNVSLKSRLFQ